MDVQDELGKLYAQLALCERLLVSLTESEMRQAIKDYASELEIRLSSCVAPRPRLRRLSQ